MNEPLSTSFSFEHASTFERVETTGNVRLGKLESMYEELFAEVIEDGIITQEERRQLDKMADNLGLDRTRLRSLESALQAAYEARHRVTIRDLSTEEAPPRSIQPLEPATDQRTLALERRIKFLEARVVDLERLLEEARSQISVEVDFSDHGAPSTNAAAEDDPLELARRVRHDPRDDASLRSLFRHTKKIGDADRAWSIASVLTYLGTANQEETDLFSAHKQAALIRPKNAITHDAWHKLLFHPEEESLVGEIFSVVVSAVLIGRLSALRRDKLLLKLDPAKKQDPVTSTLQAVRCFAWASAILGMNAPPLYVEPDFDGFCEMVPAVPPASKLGRRSLSGRTAAELAFLAGRHLASYREEHFVKMLAPTPKALEDIFLAALSIGNPGLPLSPQIKELVVPIARAIEPILEPAQIDKLRGQFLRFVEEGGRTNLARWAQAVDNTSGRAGLLLANDLKAAHAIYESEDPKTIAPRMDDLLVFTLSDRYTRLRKQLGIAVE